MVKMERFNSNVGSTQCPLEERPEVVQSLRVHLPLDVLHCMVDDFVDKLFAEMIVPDSGISIDLTAIVNVLENFVLQSLPLDVRNDLRAHLSQFTIKHSKYYRFAEVVISTHFLSATLAQCVLPVPVHLVWIRADKGFVTFYWSAIFPAELKATIILHSFADSMKHEPCRVLADSDCFAEFVATDSVLAVRQQPQGDHPLVESKRRIFHDGSNFDGELLFADIA